MTSKHSAQDSSNIIPQDAILELLRDQHLWTSDLSSSLRKIVNFCANVLSVARVGLWKLNSNGSILSCQILCDTQLCTLEPALEIYVADHPQYFAALHSQRVIAAEDASTDPATASFTESYLKPLGIGAMLDATLREGGDTIGVLCAEHMGPPRIWSNHEQHFMTSVADLLSQVLIAHKLVTGEERYRKVFNSTGDAVILMQGNELVDCNSASLSMFGCSQDEFTRYPPHHFWAEHQPSGERSQDLIKHLVKASIEGKPQFYEWRHRRFDGEEFDTEVSLNCITLDGSPHLIACIRDITERKHTQERIRQLAALQQAIFDGADYSIISTDTQGTVQSFNRAAEKLTGYVALNLMGHARITQFFPAAELQWRAIELSEELQTTIEADHQVFTAALKRETKEEREWTLVRADHSTVPVSLSVTPLIDASGQVSGYLYIGCDITERKLANEQILLSQRKMEHRANHDQLTGLPNRSKLHDTAIHVVQAAAKRNELIALLLIDLDRFKEVNDTLGHVTGDKLLQKIAMRLNKLVQEFGAKIYRLGGDEFAVLYPNPLDDAGIHLLARRIHNCLRSPTQVEDITLELGGSIGISIYPNHGDNSHSLLRCADVAMYRAKSDTTRTFIYDQEFDAHSPRRLSMMAELGAAIREDQLLLHYQPKIRISDQSCLGCEALVRWFHPVMGLVPPGEFIPLAEMSDLIRPLGMWVLNSALKQIAQWRKQGTVIPIAVNLSTRNLMDTDFPKHIESLLAEHEVPAHLLEIEITESTLIGDPERALQIIDRIHQLGVRFAIDDFGTGYSSLSYLKRLPIETLKIDRSFVGEMLSDEQDKVIVQSTLGLAHSFGLKVVAEGVEDAETLVALKELSCEEAQGFHISRPLPIDEFNTWLAQHQQRK